MNTHNQFYAQRTCNPGSIEKVVAMGKFSIFLSKVADSFKHDADPAALAVARTALKFALLSFIKDKMHADYHLECYRLLGDEFSSIAAYFRSQSDDLTASDPHSRIPSRLRG